LKDAEINEAKKVLAFEATKLCHGEAAAAAAAETARRTFEDGAAGDSLPTIRIRSMNLPKSIFTSLVESGLTASNSEARRLIQQGGVRMNDVPVLETTAALGRPNFVLQNGQNVVKLAVGKKRHLLIILDEDDGETKK
jgi:tyrosyl-tRNA synthetase